MGKRLTPDLGIRRSRNRSRGAQGKKNLWLAEVWKRRYGGFQRHQEQENAPLAALLGSESDRQGTGNDVERGEPVSTYLGAALRRKPNAGRGCRQEKPGVTLSSWR